MTDVDYPKVRLLIDGEWTDGTSGKSQEILNPATGQSIGTVPHASKADLDRALDAVSDQLLAVDEQMTILDYEIGVGLFKGLAGADRDRAPQAEGPIPPGGPRAFFRFDGEYWSDEIQDYEVRAEDRCLR